MQLGSTAPLADHPPTLAFGGASPDTGFLPHLQRIFQAGHSHATISAHRLRLESFIFVVRVEGAGFQSPARSKLTPHDLFGRHEPVPYCQWLSGWTPRSGTESRLRWGSSARPFLCDFCALSRVRWPSRRAVRRWWMAPARRLPHNWGGRWPTRPPRRRPRPARA